MGRLRGCLWLAAGLIVAVMAGFVGFFSLSRATASRSGMETEQTNVQVVVAARAVEIRSVLGPDDLTVKEMPVDTAPEGALRSLDQATGRITLVDLYAGEVILQQRLLDPNVTSADGRMALVMAEDQVLMALPAKDRMSQVGILKPGDRVDILFSVDVPANRGVLTSRGTSSDQSDEDEQVTFSLLQHGSIAAIVASRTPTGSTNVGAGAEAILVTVSPQDALILKYAIDADGIMDIVLRAPGVDQPFPVEPVDVDYLINRYQIPTGIGQ